MTHSSYNNYLSMDRFKIISETSWKWCGYNILWRTLAKYTASTHSTLVFCDIYPERQSSRKKCPQMCTQSKKNIWPQSPFACAWQQWQQTFSISKCSFRKHNKNFSHFSKITLIFLKLKQEICLFRVHMYFSYGWGKF